VLKPSHSLTAASATAQQGRQHVAGEQRRPRQEQAARGEGADDAGQRDVVLAGAADRAQRDHHQHDHHVLDDEQADGDPAVRLVDLPGVGEQLDDDDRAGEAQRQGDVEGRDEAVPERPGQPEAAARREQDLTQPGRQRHRPQRADQVQVQPQPDQEEQDGEPQLGQDDDRPLRPHPAQPHRPGEDAAGDEPDEQGLAEAEGDGGQDGGQPEHRGHGGEGLVGHGTSPADRRSLRSGP
jgi:hypothetical protein